MVGALSGIRVLDSTNIIAMPTAMHIMGDMGAEVIKVESHTLPRVGMGVFPDSDPGKDPWNRDSTFNALNRSKLGLTLNLKTPEGVDLLNDLVRVSDVLVENNRSGTMNRLGLGYEDLRKVKPDLIYLSNTGFGHTGPWRLYPGVGSMFELTCGLSQFTGYPDEGPRRVGSSWFDPHVGWMAVFAILAALHHRQQTGEGQWIDLSMYQIGLSTMGDTILDYLVNGRIGTPMGNRHPYYAPHGVYPCQGEDKWIAISVSTNKQWEALCQSMDSPVWTRDSKFGDSLSRWRNQDELDGYLRQWTSNFNHQELMTKLQKSGVNAAKVMNSEEILTDPHFKARGFFEYIEHPESSEIGSRAYVGRPWKMSDTPAHVQRPSPNLGEHNETIVGELLGCDEAEIAKLYEKGVLGKDPTEQPRIRPEISFEEQIEDGTATGYNSNYKEVLGYKQ